jgi:hypothetical protein
VAADFDAMRAVESIVFGSTLLRRRSEVNRHACLSLLFPLTVASDRAN